ncbi:probable transcriptional regulatory protein Kole_1935 [Corticium candelabrum]|uniref:probable transcriptional regulatory protein Kole_1935 n=1 Tax=Corticium candelabrum TaxID=121492 RepID=UPI002E25EC6F|nr:probable transcriptional regulatory protein Kole_1935 [Corticium candelabrum]
MDLFRRSCCIFRPLACRRWPDLTFYRFSGHNKWSKIKQRKESADIRRSKVIAKLVREIRAAVREGGADVNHNLQLASLVSRAQEMDIPKATIQTAIGNAAGGRGEGEKMMVEARGQTGYALLIETVTDNKQRTRYEIQRILVKNGGTVREQGSSLYSFAPKGVITINGNDIGQNTEPFEVGIEVGAEDVSVEVTEKENIVQFLCEANQLKKMKENIESTGLQTKSVALVYVPQNTVDLSSTETEKAVKLIDALDDHNDVVNIFDNIAKGNNS